MASEEKLACSECDFKARSVGGLRTHARVHKLAAKRERAPEEEKVPLKKQQQVKEQSPSSSSSSSSSSEEEGEEEKANVNDWEVGNNVSVRLTGVPKFENFTCCHMDGVVTEVTDAHVTVHFEQLGREARVEHDRLSHTRGPNVRVQWKVGDKVHVLETNEGVDGWWEATVVKPWGKSWVVKWTAEYEAHGNESRAASKNMRRAH